MDSTLSRYMRLATPHLRSCLVSPEALSHIDQIACLLPPAGASGFECRLAEEARYDGIGFAHRAAAAAGLPDRGHVVNVDPELQWHGYFEGAAPGVSPGLSRINCSKRKGGGLSK